MSQEIDYLELLAKSEQRIDRTNEMIDKLVTCVDKLSSIYEKHIEQLSTSRDELIKQNMSLISILRESKDDFERSLKVQERLIIALTSKQTSINFGDVGYGHSKNP